jgi:hypothetical protein
MDLDVAKRALETDGTVVATQVGMMVYSLDAPPGIRVAFDEITCASP